MGQKKLLTQKTYQGVFGLVWLDTVRESFFFLQNLGQLML